MRDYIIMTDSCCDLTDHMARELELNVVPLTVHMDGHDYANMLDGSQISFEDFYRNIRSGVLGTTSAANVGQFEDAMRAVLAQDKDIVCINFSSALSATYQNACIAAKTMADEFPDSRVYVVDSLSASLGQGLLLYLAVQKKREGLSAPELVQWVEDNKLHVDHWFTVDDLNHLKLGGRVSAAAGWVRHHRVSGYHAVHQAGDAHLRRGQAGARQQGPRPQGQPASPYRQGGGAGHRAQRAGDVHLPRRLRGGGPRRGRGAEGPLRREGGLHQLHRPGDRQPYRPQHHGSVLRGHQALTPSHFRRERTWNGWS